MSFSFPRWTGTWITKYCIQMYSAKCKHYCSSGDLQGTCIRKNLCYRGEPIHTLACWRVNMFNQSSHQEWCLLPNPGCLWTFGRRIGFGAGPARRGQADVITKPPVTPALLKIRVTRTRFWFVLLRVCVCRHLSWSPEPRCLHADALLLLWLGATSRFSNQWFWHF